MQGLSPPLEAAAVALLRAKAGMAQARIRRVGGAVADEARRARGRPFLHGISINVRRALPVMRLLLTSSMPGKPIVVPRNRIAGASFLYGQGHLNLKWLLWNLGRSIFSRVGIHRIQRLPAIRSIGAFFCVMRWASAQSPVLAEALSARLQSAAADHPAAEAGSGQSRLPDGSEFVSWEQRLTFSKTYYVDNQSPRAGDNGPGTKSHPFRTINKAAQVLMPGERVVIASGIYRECVRPARGGASPALMISYEAVAGGEGLHQGL